MLTSPHIVNQYVGTQKQTSWSLVFFAAPLIPHRIGVFQLPAGGREEAACRWTSMRSHIKIYTRQLTQRVMRYRMERFLFDTTYYRTYVYFKSILNLTLYRFSFWRRAEQHFLASISNKTGKQFLVNESFSYLLVRSVGLVFTVVGGLFFFTRLFGSLMYQFRRHWALIRYVGNLLNLVRLHFWYHSHVQFRIMMFGRFGGIMRASKQVLGQGPLKLYVWQGVMDYVQSDFCTKWGTFGFSFWLQFHNVPQLKINRFVQRYRKILRAIALGETTMLERIMQMKRRNQHGFRALSINSVVSNAERRRDFGVRLYRNPVETPFRLLSAWRSITVTRGRPTNARVHEGTAPRYTVPAPSTNGGTLNLFNTAPRFVRTRPLSRRHKTVRLVRFAIKWHRKLVRIARNRWRNSVGERVVWRRIRGGRFVKQSFRKSAQTKKPKYVSTASRQATGRVLRTQVVYGSSPLVRKLALRHNFARQQRAFWTPGRWRFSWAIRRFERHFRWHFLYPKARRFTRRWVRFYRTLNRHIAPAA